MLNKINRNKQASVLFCILSFTTIVSGSLFNWTGGGGGGGGQQVSPVTTKVEHPQTWNPETEKECYDWFTLCADFEGYQSNTKACFGNTTYFVPDFRSDWQSARLYCMNIFKSYPNADVLYFDTAGDEDLARFLQKFLRKSDWSVVPTSAICCPMLTETDSSVECKWVYDPADALDPKLLTDVTDLDAKDCYFLMANLSTNHLNPKFVRARLLTDETEYNYICSYKLPSYCSHSDRITTTTTSRSTIRTTTKHTKSTTKSSSDATKPSTSTTTTMKTTTTTIGPDEKFCPELHDQYGIKVWPSAKINETSRAECPADFEGIAEWLCGMDGRFVPEGPHITCTRKWIKPIIEDFEKVKNMDELVDGLDRFHSNITEDPVKFADDLAQVIVVVDKVHTLFESFASESNNKTDDQQVKNVAGKILDSCSKIIENDQPWDASKPNKRTEIAGQMLEYIQRSGLTVGCFVANNQSESKWKQPISPENNTNIYLDAFNMDERQQIRFQHLDHWFSLEKPLYTDEIVSEWCPHRMGVGALFKRLSAYLFDPQQTERKKQSMNSEIIAFTYNNKTIETSKLPDDNEAHMSLVHHERMAFGAEPKCVFWNYTSKSWSSDGCRVDFRSSDRNQTTCVCNHLTNFAVLMDISNREEPSQLKSILTIVTCAASIVCLVLTVAVFHVCREIRKKRTSIIVNISVIMILIDLLVIFGLDQTDHPIVCKSVSVSLLYLMLALFFWMLMEGYNLYQMMILIFDSKGRLRLLYLYLIAYGIPLVITIAGVIYMYFQTELTNEYFCWITSTKYPYQIWILAAPVTVIILINTYIMIRVMKIVLNQNKNRNSMIGVPSVSSTSANGSGYYRTNVTNAEQRARSRNKSKLPALYPKLDDDPNQPQQQQQQQPSGPSLEEKLSEWYSYLKGFFGLIVLMGITWISYLLYIHRYGHYFSYVFIVMNGLQGVFIFITQILMNKKARSSILRRFYQMIGKDDYSSTSSTSRNTTSSYLSQQRASKPSLGNINQTRQDNDGDGDDPNLTAMNRDQNPFNALINRSTSMEF